MGRVIQRAAPSMCATVLTQVLDFSRKSVFVMIICANGLFLPVYPQVGVHGAALQCLSVGAIFVFPKGNCRRINDFLWVILQAGRGYSIILGFPPLPKTKAWEVWKRLQGSEGRPPPGGFLAAPWSPHCLPRPHLAHPITERRALPSIPSSTSLGWYSHPTEVQMVVPRLEMRGSSLACTPNVTGRQSGLWGNLLHWPRQWRGRFSHWARKAGSYQWIWSKCES